jgi:hypothetical protein
MKKYWHQIELEQQEEILKTPGLTVQEFLDTYDQPDWCNYPDALDGPMGCWSLLFSKSVRSIKDCGNCDCIKNKH